MYSPGPTHTNMAGKWRKHIAIIPRKTTLGSWVWMKTIYSRNMTVVSLMRKQVKFRSQHVLPEDFAQARLSLHDPYGILQPEFWTDQGMNA